MTQGFVENWMAIMTGENWLDRIETDWIIEEIE